MTPHEAWYNVKPDLSTLRIFGSEFYVLVPKQVREGKLESVGVLVYFVGNSETQKGERYYDPSSGKVNASRDTTSVRRHFEPRLSSSDLTTAQRDVITLPPTGVYTPTQKLNHRLFHSNIFQHTSSRKEKMRATTKK